MELSQATNAVGAHVEAGRSVSRASDLSQHERIFVDVFTANGGKATEAALAAGCPEPSAHVQASRMLCRPRVAAAIKARCESFAHACLPVAIQTLLEICGNDKLLPKDRIKAANSLVELAGMTAPHGGMTLNVGVQVNGQQAQAIIQSVHDARSARLSDIPPAMPDTLGSDLKMIEGTIERLAGDPPGGDRDQGTLGPDCPLPVSDPEQPQKSRVSCECEKCRGMEAPDGIAEDPFDAFRQAFDDDDHSQGDEA